LYIVGIEKIPDEALKAIVSEATEELERRNDQKIRLADEITRAIYKAQDEGLHVHIHTADGVLVVPDEIGTYVVNVV